VAGQGLAEPAGQPQLGALGGDVDDGTAAGDRYGDMSAVHV